MTEAIVELGLLDEEDIVLDDAALALAASDHPGLDLQPYRALLDEIADRLGDTGSDASTTLARAERLSATLSGDFGFIGDRDTYDDPDNADLIRVIDRRRGLPVSLSILYVATARRIGWDAHVLDVPGHVLVLVGDEASPRIIDPFRAGVAVAPEELAALMSHQHGGNRPAVRHVATMSNRAVLVRLLLNQATRAEAAGKARRALTLYGRITQFAPGHGGCWWDRARLELIDGRVADARASLTAMLEVTRDPEVRRRIVGTLSTLAGS